MPRQLRSGGRYYVANDCQCSPRHSVLHIGVINVITLRRKSMAESEAQRDLDLCIAVLRHARKMRSDWQRLAGFLAEESTQVLSTL
jgi:hypothetical protein